MTQDFNISLFDSNDVLAKVQTAGFDKIRCTLTGQVIAEIQPQFIINAIQYLRFEQPLLTDSQLVDLMQIRWIVSCSRPAPHLVAFKSHDAHTYLVKNHPKDMFAILMGRLLFEHEKINLQMTEMDAQKAKLFWLIQLQESEDFQKFGPAYKSALDALIRLDSIHSIRKAYYSSKIREIAAAVRDSAITEKMLAAFIDEVESRGFKALAARMSPPEGNRQSLNAALAQAGVLPWQLRLRENEAKQKTNAHAFAARVLESKKMDEFERIKAGYGEKHTAVLSELSGQIPAILHQKYADALKREDDKKAAAKNQSEPKPKAAKKVSAASIRAQARFGNLDFSF